MEIMEDKSLLEEGIWYRCRAKQDLTDAGLTDLWERLGGNCEIRCYPPTIPECEGRWGRYAFNIISRRVFGAGEERIIANAGLTLLIGVKKDGEFIHFND